MYTNQTNTYPSYGQPIARHSAPELTLDETNSLDHVQATISSWNNSLKHSLPGLGYYGFNPNADMSNDGLHHFVLFADEVFYNAFMESHEEIEVTSVPADELPAVA